TTGGVEIKGNSGFLISKSASYIVIRGFKFTHAAGTTKIEAGASFCRFTRNVFECTGDGAYLVVSGNDNQIDHNTFQNKSTVGQMISVQGPGTSEMAQRTWIHHNYFSNFTPVANNCSSIQVGLSGRSLSPAHTLVENNLFSQTRGENENICNKSCDNIYRYNTFGEGVSELSLRHGNRCQVYGNFFIGSEGIRFYGHQHKIYSNYFERCNPAINIGNGDGIVPKDKLTSHDRPDSVSIAGNTLYNNTRNVIMQDRKNGLGATCITFANNIIQGGSVAVKVDGTIVNPVWEGNIIWKTNGIGTIPAGGYTESDPKLILGDKEAAHIQSDSPAIGNARGSYPFATVDIDGQTRTSKLDIGADQVEKDKGFNHVLTVEEVGASSKY
ncbi:MAG: polysaccharide lyase 6 family protein, partial [Bacteroidetes bacterium]|nr:polysaccharide lyase 6 family protein [Bacteroidota bacterium]